MQKIHDEQNIKALNEDKILPFTCILQIHSPQTNPGPGFNKTLFVKVDSRPWG